jgi:hypothetical protein
MKPSILLRIAAILTLLYAAGHTMGMPWTPSTGPQQSALIEQMKSNPFEVMGSVRTYWDFYFGFGVAISAYLVVQAVVLWLLAPLASDNALRLRPIIAALFIAFAVNAVIVYMYFFVVPLILALAIAVCLALAFISAKPSRSA